MMTAPLCSLLNSGGVTNAMPLRWDAIACCRWSTVVVFVAAMLGLIWGLERV